jgi:hypothetical protein
MRMTMAKYDFEGLRQHSRYEQLFKFITEISISARLFGYLITPSRSIDDEKEIVICLDLDLDDKIKSKSYRFAYFVGCSRSIEKDKKLIEMMIVDGFKNLARETLKIPFAVAEVDDED